MKQIILSHQTALKALRQYRLKQKFSNNDALEVIVTNPNELYKTQNFNQHLIA